MPAEQESNPVREQKDSLWSETRAELDELADGLGLPIDAGVKEAVTAFRVNGFPTGQSCEGHVEERFGEMVKLRPYVQVELPTPEQRFVGEAEIKNQVATKFGVLPEEVEDFDGHEDACRAYWDYIQKNDVPETAEYLAVRAKHEEMRASVADLLAQFYSRRHVQDHSKLVIEDIGADGAFRVTSANENPTQVEAEQVSEMEKELREQQVEIKAFAEFLRDRFYSQI
jgi:hypothetical protein